MELLFSNYPPLKTRCLTFYDAFIRTLSRADALDIAVGYVSADSLAELGRMVEENGISRLTLTIGMHYIDKFTKPQYNAAMRLNDFLLSNHCGEVRLVTPFRFHGKMYLGSKQQTPFAGIIGSNNLSSIVEGGDSIYESSILLDDAHTVVSMKQFIDQLNQRATQRISDCEITEFNVVNHVLEGQEGVEQISQAELIHAWAKKTDISFEIPIKTEEKSNLNAYFGKGRENRQNGVILPRHWYETELIVPVDITRRPHYPQERTPQAIFDVITDDGYKFKCKISGTNSKNFRSEGDLRILGRWLKGRMENDDVLRSGEMVTESVLNAYGRKTLTFTKTTTPNLWLLDFGVKK